MIYWLFSLFAVFIVQDADVVLNLQKKFSEIRTLKADFIQSSSGNSSISGKFFFKKENNYRINLISNLIISDGITIWNRDIKRKKVIISNLNEDPLAFSLNDYIFNYPAKCKINEEKLDIGYLVTLKPEDASLNFRSAKLWITDRYDIRKITVFDFGGNYFSFEFSNIKIDSWISDELFKYKNEENDKIIDLR